MMTSTRGSRWSHALSVAAFSIAMVASGVVGQDKPGGPGDAGGLDIPGLGNSAPDGCSLTSSDPGHRSSCNSAGHNGKNGMPGSANGTGNYRDHPGYRDYRDYRYPDVHPPASRGADGGSSPSQH